MATDVSAPLPDIDWPDQALIGVDAGDSSTVITAVVVHLSQDVPEELLTAEPFTPLFVYGKAQ